MSKYKVGDKVRVIACECGHCFDIGEVVKITKVCPDDYLATNIKGVSWYVVNDEVEPIDIPKIVITTDGNTTLARLYENNKVIKTATAKCSPEDEFDFNVGAELAFNRLIGKPCGKEEPKPKYYNGKAVCVKTFDSDFTVGKVYAIKDGKFTDNNERTRPITPDRVTCADDLTKGYYFKCWLYHFIPLVEIDSNEPLTIAQLKNMNGQKVYVVSLDAVGNEDFKPNHSGWRTVDTKVDRLYNDKGYYYRFDGMNEPFGFHAYLKEKVKEV